MRNPFIAFGYLLAAIGVCTFLQTTAWTQELSRREKQLLNERQNNRRLQKPVISDSIEKDITRIKALAENGDAYARLVLGEMYYEGNGVSRSCEEAFKWWLEAAQQGIRTAQHNVGIMYVTGSGVRRSQEQAIKWLSKAAEQGDSTAEQYAQRLKLNLTASLPLVVTNNLSSLAQNTKQETLDDPNAIRNVRILSEILKEYHTNHTYMATGGEPIYACAQMSCDIWNMAKTKGITAKIRIGNVREDIKSLLSANHAWVMAEVSPGNWLALESTAGIIIYPNQNHRHYSGIFHDFQDPKELTEYENLLREYNSSARKHNEALNDYNQAFNYYQAFDYYNTGNTYVRQKLWIDVERKEAILKERKEDVEELGTKVLALLEK